MDELYNTTGAAPGRDRPAARGRPALRDETGPYLTPAEHGGSTAPQSQPTGSLSSFGLVLPCAFGDYELLEELGRGGMGVVYKARQRSLGRLVALKMLRECARSSSINVERLELEARAAAALDHPNIVPVFEVGQYGVRPYLTMAYVAGETLAVKAKDNGLPIAEAVRMVMVVAEAVAHVHRHGIIHRDLKPSNILIDGEGRPRVTDFGLAKQLGVEGSLSASGELIGTPCFMAPEQAVGSGKGVVGPAADIYALGGLLYYALTGARPMTGDSITDVLVKVLYEPPVPIRQIKPEVPAELEAICLKCLSKDAAGRYASAGELAEALRPWANSDDRVVAVDLSASLPPAARAAAPPPGQDPGRARWRRLVAGVMAAGLMGGSVVYLLSGYRPSAPAVAEVPPTDQRGGELTPAEQGANLPVLLDRNVPARHEFELSVELVGSAAGAGGERLLDKCEQKLALRVERDAYVGIWTVGPDDVVVQLFPNKYEADHYVRGGQARVIPGNDQYRIDADPSRGLEKLLVVAATRRWAPIEGERLGPFAVFRSAADRDRWRQQFRGLVIRPASPEPAAAAVSEMTIPYRVRGEP